LKFDVMASEKRF